MPSWQQIWNKKCFPDSKCPRNRVPKEYLMSGPNLELRKRTFHRSGKRLTLVMLNILRLPALIKIVGNKAKGRISVCVSGGKKCSFFGKLCVLYFLGTPVSRFAFLTYYRRLIPYFLKKV